MASPSALTIAALNNDAQQQAVQRQRELLKPLGALGRLEDVAIWFAARQGQAIPAPLIPAIAVFAADHGVAQQGVSAYPQSVTREMLKSLAGGKAAIAVLAAELQCHYAVIDVGVIAADNLPGIQNKSLAQGTQDLSHTAAMSSAQAQQAMQIGADEAQRMIDAGANALIAGEVGIGNTTAAACLIAALTKIDAGMIVGSGTGLDAAQRQHKLSIVRQALARVGNQTEPLALLAELGGFEIAAMCGFYLHAARHGTPILLDGFISTAAALIVCAMQPAAREWMLATHQSAELGHALALEHLQLKPLLNLNLRLGEGSGAALLVSLLQSALTLHRNMATFSEAGVSEAG